MSTACLPTWGNTQKEMKPLQRRDNDGSRVLLAC